MGGGLIQLVAYGAQDIYITGNPQITFFKAVYKRYTNFAVDQDLETWCGERVEKWLCSKDLKRHIKKGSIIKEGENVYTWKHHVTSQMIRKNHPKAIIMNDLPFEEALTLYMGEA